MWWGFLKFWKVAAHLNPLSESLSLSCESADVPLARLQHLSSRSAVIREAWLLSGPWQACERSNIPVYTRSAQCDSPWDAWTQIPNPCFCCQHASPVHLLGLTKPQRFRCCFCLLFLIHPFVFVVAFWRDNWEGARRIQGPKWNVCRGIEWICKDY